MQSDFYKQFYIKVPKSTIHSRFCEVSYGIDLCQHGFTDKAQLNFAINVASIKSTHNVLDLGCGNGMMIEYLFNCTGASFTGIDNSIVAINQAKQRTQGKNERLTFMEGDINDLCLPATSFDRIMLIDTIYFSSNYDQTLSKLKAALKPQGFIVIFYSIGPALLESKEFPIQLLNADSTPLAQVLSTNGFTIQYFDLTSQDYALARKRKEFLMNHKKDFRHDGIDFVYENRMGDSTDIIKYIEEGLHRRYLYLAQVR